MLTALDSGHHDDKVWFGRPVCPDQLIILFHARTRMDGDRAELPPVPETVQVITGVRSSY